MSDTKLIALHAQGPPYPHRGRGTWDKLQCPQLAKTEGGWTAMGGYCKLPTATAMGSTATLTAGGIRTSCNWDQLQLGPTATETNCNWGQLQLGPTATGTNCNWDQLQLQLQ